MSNLWGINLVETTDMNKPMIWNELVLGFVVIESCQYHSIRTMPIVTASNSQEILFTDNLSRLTKLEKDETVKGILPVPFPTYEITGSMTAEGEELSNIFLLGYEYPGVQPPDWMQVLKREIANPNRCE